MKLTYTIKKSKNIILLALALVGFLTFSGITYAAAVTNGTMTGNAVADLVASSTDVDYNFSFDAATVATSTSITITFPVGFAITNGTIATSSICNRACALAGKISASSTDVAVTGLTGSTAARTIVIAFAASNLNSSTTVFRITAGIQNATTTGLTGTSSIVTNAVGSTAQNDVAGVTLTYDAVVATKLVFTTQPGGAVSGIVLTTQPVVTAQDNSGVTDMDFVSTVTLTDTGVGTIAAPGNTQAAVSGVATFTGVIYIPSADSEPATLLANGGSLTEGESSSFTAVFFHGVGGKIYYPVAEPTTAVAPEVPAPVATEPVVSTPVVTPPASVPATAAEQQQLIVMLLGQLKALVQQAMALGIQVSPQLQAYLVPSKLSDVTSNLMLGSAGQEVKMLQQFLNSNGFELAQSGVGSKGQETMYLGALTRAALMKYQASKDLFVSGILDSATRAYLQSVGF